ncbi:MAG: phosphatase 2C-like domain-containing protein [Monoraphidium minutum]|nr:MAG: phosphatase 2C-like domain-containing protein [Monoraphidium minutum]
MRPADGRLGHPKGGAAVESFRVQDLSHGGNLSFSWGAAATQGRRTGMEDAHVVNLDLDGGGATALFAVFDGHAGAEVAAFCARHICCAVVDAPAYRAGDLEGALSEARSGGGLRGGAYLRLDAMLTDPVHRQELACLNAGLRPGRNPAANQALAEQYGTLHEQGVYLGAKAGCTACVTVVRGGDMFVANVGDSRCALCEAGGAAVSLTRDHKPGLLGEGERVKRAGFAVVHNRVYGARSSLAMSRALGDTKYKDPHLPPEEQAVCPVPETTQYVVGTAASAAVGAPAGPGLLAGGGDPGAAEAAEFVILACDGVFDCMSNEQAVAFVRERLRRGAAPQQAALALVDECLSPETATPVSMDNITALVVCFRPAPGSVVLGGSRSLA